MGLVALRKEAQEATINLESLFKNEESLGLCYVDSNGATRAFTFTLEDMKSNELTQIKSTLIK